jgi:hypothetical protein
VAFALKRADASASIDLRLTLGGHALPSIQVDGAWREHRWQLPAGMLKQGKLQAHIASSDRNARFVVDHVLLLPRNSELVAQH